MRRQLAVPFAIVLAASGPLVGQQAQPSPQAPVFRSRISLVLVDFVVRDRSGALVKGLSADDFDVFEDGVRQQVLTFAFEDVTSLTGQTRDISAPIERASTLVAADNTPSHPLTSEEVAGHRLLTLLFDTEVYDPAADHGAAQLRTNLTFYRRRVKVFETPVVERTRVDAADRQAAVFQFEIPAGSLEPGLYTCQVSIIDAVASRFAFPRLQLYIR